MDADVGMGELELIYMKGSKAHSGFPEVSTTTLSFLSYYARHGLLTRIHSLSLFFSFRFLTANLQAL